jgi:hypothetical protein
VPNLKDIKIRINSVIKTRQITQAMKLVATAKLKGATERALAAKPYQQALKGALARVVSKAGSELSNPLLRQPARVQRILVVCFTSDRGLCGGFNNILMRRATAWMAERQAEKIELDVHVFGRKGRDFLNGRRIKPIGAVVDYVKTPRMDLVRPSPTCWRPGSARATTTSSGWRTTPTRTPRRRCPTYKRVLPLSVDAALRTTARRSAEYTLRAGLQAGPRHDVAHCTSAPSAPPGLPRDGGRRVRRAHDRDGQRDPERQRHDRRPHARSTTARARPRSRTEIIEIVSGAEALKGQLN